jgi:hypothetical protein
MAQADPSAAPQASAADPFILAPLRDVAGWVAAFDAREIPVLAATANSLEDLRCNEDAVDAHLLADTMQSDPLMTLKLLRHVAMLRRGRLRAADSSCPRPSSCGPGPACLPPGCRCPAAARL